MSDEEKIRNAIPDEWLKMMLNYVPLEHIISTAKLVSERRKTHTIFPESHNVFSAFKFFYPRDTKVVILGQD